MSKFQTTAFLSAILVTITYSDIAPNPIFSESIQAFNETQVQMVSELVTVDLYKGYSEVRIEFTMKNHGDDTTLEVGFPNTPNWRENDALTNFTVSVDSETYLHQKKKRETGGKYKKFRNWFVWDMTFKKMETKIVTVSYHQPWGPKYSSGLLRSRYFHYIMETGAGWYGNIEEAIVVVNLKDMTSEHLNAVKPDGYSVTENEIKWVFNDVEPTGDHNINIDYNYYRNYGAYVEINAPSMNTNSWLSAWELAYASNKAGDYRAAIRFAEGGIEIPLKHGGFGNFLDLDELKLYKNIALYKQVAMARYKLYLNEGSADNNGKLQDAINHLQILSLQVIENPEAIEELFPKENYDDVAYEWLLSEFVMDDESITIGKGRELGVFALGWKDKIEAALKGQSKVQMVEQHVDIDLYRSYSDIRAVFTLKNHGADTDLVINLSDIAGHNYLSDTFSNLTLTLDEKSLPIEAKPTAPATNTTSRSNWDPTWNMTFKNTESKELTLKYKVPHDNRYLRDELLHPISYRYNLHGSSWNKCVEHVTVIVNLRDFTTDNLEYPERFQSNISGNRLTWEFRHWEPERGVSFYINTYRDCSDYIAQHRNKEIVQWRDAWWLAYACNKAKQYELAAQSAEKGIQTPYYTSDTGKTTDVKKQWKRDTSNDPDLALFKEIALYKQLVMARYQLYLIDASKSNRRKLQKAVAGLRNWASQDAGFKEGAENLFPTKDYEDASYQWLMTEYIVNDEDPNLTVFRRGWKKRINELTNSDVPTD